MEDIIYIDFICIYDKSFFFNINDKLTIKINYLNNITLFEYTYDINYNIDKNVNSKDYFIRISQNIKNTLTTNNFIINLPKYYYFEYGYYKNNNYKSLIIFRDYNYLQLIYLGLPNFKSKKFFQINYKYKKINQNIITDCSGNTNICNCDLDCSGNYNGNTNYQTTLFNNYFGNSNYYLNSLKIQGNIYQICINNNNGIISYDNNVVNNYKLFKIKNNMDVDVNTNIYFYDDTSGNFLSYVINLNTYNFSPIKNIPLELETIITSINYMTDSSGSVYNSILSLNMQTYNPNQLCQIQNDSSGNYYYNTLFFFNYVNQDYYVDSINVFSYDYDKYFINTQIPVEFNNINSNSCQSNLYEFIINSDSNLSNPFILNIIEPYLYMNLDYINLDTKLINLNYSNYYFYNLTKSNKINLDILEKYLINYFIKKYNIFKLINIRYIEQNNKIKRNIVKNELYIDDSLHEILYLYKNPNEFINFNNNIVNCIRCKVIFYYKSNTNYQINGYYTVDAKLFLNNYNLELYHKEYDFENISSSIKKKLIDMLLFLQTTTYQVKLYFYNIKNSVVPAYYIFNQVELFKNVKDFDTIINVNILDNLYTNGFLKFEIIVNKEYYLLFLYADIDSFLNTSNYDELIFYYNTFIFKIFKIDKPNGNTLENKLLFYICFQNLKEINIFMDFIKSGIMNTNYNNKLSSYFNIEKSVTFYNYYDLNNYWVVKEEPTINNKNKINFSINNLYINQIYLYGDLFIECS